jgi:hypothetical protein
MQAATRAHDIADVGRWFESSLGAIANINEKQCRFTPARAEAH